MSPWDFLWGFLLESAHFLQIYLAVWEAVLCEEVEYINPVNSLDVAKPSGHIIAKSCFAYNAVKVLVFSTLVILLGKCV